MDCLGLVGFLLRRALGLEVEDRESPGGDLRLSQAFLPVWVSPPNVPDDVWVRMLQPWDVLMWQCAAAQGPLQAMGSPDITWLHAGLAVNRDTLVSATMDQGVILHSAHRTAELYGPAVMCLVRPTGISAWEPACSPPAAEQRQLQSPDWVSTGVYEDEQPNVSREILREWYGHDE